MGDTVYQCMMYLQTIDSMLCSTYLKIYHSSCFDIFSFSLLKNFWCLDNFTCKKRFWWNSNICYGIICLCIQVNSVQTVYVEIIQVFNPPNNFCIQHSLVWSLNETWILCLHEQNFEFVISCLLYWYADKVHTYTSLFVFFVKLHKVLCYNDEHK